MKRKQALQLAIDALQKEYRKWLFVSDTSAGEKKRAEISMAIEILDSMRRQREMTL